MNSEVWISIGAGGGLALAYGLLSFLSLRRALRQEAASFFAVFIGGMVVRMMLILATLLAVLLLVPLRPGPVVLTFVGLLTLGMVVEVYVLHSRAARAGAPANPSRR